MVSSYPLSLMRHAKKTSTIADRTLLQRWNNLEDAKREILWKSALGCNIVAPLALPPLQHDDVKSNIGYLLFTKIKSLSLSKQAAVSLARNLLQGEINENFSRLLGRNLETGSLIPAFVITSVFEEIITSEAEEVLRQVLEYEIGLFWEEGFLKCDNDCDLHQEIINLLSEKDFHDYLTNKYPLLRLRCSARIELSTSALEKFLIRFSQDLPELVSLGFLSSEKTTISSIQNTGSDSHLLAQRVLIVGFSTNEKLVYKPRSVDGEVALYKLIVWMNNNIPGLSLRGARALAKQEHGWLEYVEHCNVSSLHQIEDYYNRYGRLAALIRFLSGNDIHFENLVACGATPVIIDAETIMPTSSFTKDISASGAHTVVNREDDTVLYTGMVDQADFFDNFSGSPLSTPPDRKGKWSDIQIGANGDLIFTCETVLREHNHLPSVDGRPEGCASFTNHIIAGYEEVFRFLMTNRIASEKISKNIMSSHPNIRAIFRYTNVYEKFRQGLYSPFALKSISNSEDMLSDLCAVCDDRPGHEGLIALEWESLWHGDIPHFQCSAFSHSLEAGGIGSISEYLQESAFDIFKRKISRRSFVDIEEDIYFFKYLLISKEKHARHNGESDSKIIENYEPLDYFRDVLNSLIIDDGRILISDPRINNYIEHDIGIINHNLYTGTGGIVFSLLYALETQQEVEKIARLGEICLLHATKDSSRLLGACEGLGGFIWLSSHLGYKTKEKIFFDIGVELAKRANQVVFKDRYYDVFSGAAGLIQSLYSLHSASGDRNMAAYIDNAGQFLLDQSIEYDGMIAWNSPLLQSKPSSGFAHGAAGIGSALIKAYVATNENKYLNAVVRVSRFLERCFLNKTLKWADYIGDDGSYHSNFWCHGTPGVYQFYFEAKAHDIDVGMSQELFSQISHAISRDFVCDNDSLCHGTFGNLDSLMEFGVRDPEIHDIISGSLAKYKNREHICGTVNNLHSHGLFTGQSGISYEFLRARDPLNYPSVLRFDAPVLTWGNQRTVN